MNLQNKRILLTGATGGLGQMLAQKLAAKGATLALVGRDLTVLKKQKSQLEPLTQVEIIQADLSQAHVLKDIFEDAATKLGGIDILINNAGILDFIAFEDQTPARIAEIIHINVTALIQLSNLAMPHFLARNSGQFVFIGSIFGSLGFPHFTTYCASKFAVHGFSQALRRELVSTNIGVTYIAPRGIQTPMMGANTTAMWQKEGSKLDAPEKVAEAIIQGLEKNRQEVFIGQPQSFFAWLNGVAPQLVNMGLKKQTALAAPFLPKK